MTLVALVHRFHSADVAVEALDAPESADVVRWPPPRRAELPWKHRMHQDAPESADAVADEVLWHAKSPWVHQMHQGRWVHSLADAAPRHVAVEAPDVSESPESVDDLSGEGKPSQETSIELVSCSCGTQKTWFVPGRL